MNKLIRALGGFVLSLIICHAAGANAGHEWQVSAGKVAAIAVDGRQLRIDRSLTLMLRRAEAAAFLPLEFNGSPAKSWRWLLVREPSKARGSASFCGAGYEDRLLLVEVAKSTGKVVGQFLAQSCLNSISMDIDQFDELLAAIGIEEQNGRLTLEQSISSDAGSARKNVQIDVSSGRMKVFMRKVED
ncbi:hypothetical protein [Aquabacterium sp. CECT 9606]|uniref:hypothetical protein n=1 Tax=Aquabacterium sp. CECT 9606 TaxID=2845822 RepID=UPI001E656B5A|nr:hypothetical protein [Aquabacterium sp. CECT 9606]